MITRLQKAKLEIKQKGDVSLDCIVRFGEIEIPATSITLKMDAGEPPFVYFKVPADVVDIEIEKIEGAIEKE